MSFPQFITIHDDDRARRPIKIYIEVKVIAVISSTIAPDVSLSRDGSRSLFSVDERVEQTRLTLDSLNRIGIDTVLLMDNSPENIVPKFSEFLSNAKMIHCPQPSFSNRGFGELWLLLAAIPHLAEGVPILKISGRYHLDENTPLVSPPEADLVSRCYGTRKARSVSTRAYVLRDKRVAQTLWRRTLEEMYGDAAKVVGPRSAWRILRNALHLGPAAFSDGEPSASIERSLYKAACQLGLQQKFIPLLGLKGVIAGTSQTVIDE